jgi:TetR/AcrR family tetracycline transcriptional repressor
MRLLAKELGVQAAALYWHLKDKRQLLDAMAGLMFHDLNERLEAPRKGVDWADWIGDRVRDTRAMMLKYRDGARVFAGTYIAESELPRSIEITLATLVDGGFSPRDAARGFSTLFNYAIGFTIEEQSRSGADYPEANPYGRGRTIDAQRFPLAAQAAGDLFIAGDAGFDDGLQTIIAGLRARYLTG